MRIFASALLALICVGVSTPAFACKLTQPIAKNGEIKFEYVICKIAGQSTQLMEQVRKEFSRQDVKAAAVTCTNVELGKKFRKVGDIRIPPFSCKIGGKYLLVNGDVLIYDTEARAGPRPRDSDYLIMANPKWSWR